MHIDRLIRLPRVLIIGEVHIIMNIMISSPGWLCLRYKCLLKTIFTVFLVTTAEVLI